MNSVTYAFAALLALPLAASEPAAARPKPAWQWTLDERLAKRFDTASQMDRITPQATEPYGVLSVPDAAIANPSATAAKLPSIIVGVRNPELLLPWELFDVLVSGALSADSTTRDEERRELADNARTAGLTLPPDFWKTLETAARPQWEMEHRAIAIGRRIQKAAADEVPSVRAEYVRNYEGLCEARADSIERARAAFGAEWFDRFLYEAVAPRTVQIKPGGVDDPHLLRVIDGGCRPGVGAGRFARPGGRSGRLYTLNAR